MINKYSVEDCCGCAYCSAICPTNAIKMVPNFKGFYYPKIDMEKCVNCNLCERECIFNNNIASQCTTQSYYLARIKNEETLLKSTSGGFFTVLSDYFLQQNGIIIGATLDNKFVVKHTLATSKSERDKMRGSKYVQSNILDVYSMIDNNIIDNQILFVGTPCQVSAIVNYVKKKFSKYKNNLITIDIICHGVPSPSLWRDHVSLLPNTNEILNITFRSKLEGWHSNLDVVSYKDSSIITGHDKNINGANVGKMTELFYKHLSFRESCSKCRFTSLDRVGDFTIGDAWGIEKNNKDLDDNKGWSIVFTNTTKAKKIFDSVSSNITFSKINDISYFMQPQLSTPIMLGKQYNKFWDDYRKFGGEYCFKKYTTYGFRNRIFYSFKQVLKTIISK